MKNFRFEDIKSVAKMIEANPEILSNLFEIIEQADSFDDVVSRLKAEADLMLTRDLNNLFEFVKIKYR